MYYYKFFGNLFSSVQEPYLAEGATILTEEQYNAEIAELQAQAEEEQPTDDEATIEDYQAALAELEESL